jgi:hypothetical protein
VIVLLRKTGGVTRRDGIRNEEIEALEGRCGMTVQHNSIEKIMLFLVMFAGWT